MGFLEVLKVCIIQSASIIFLLKVQGRSGMLYAFMRFAVNIRFSLKNNDFFADPAVLCSYRDYALIAIWAYRNSTVNVELFQ